jgi:membrane protease YdiL (CAAX protease family)
MILINAKQPTIEEVFTIVVKQGIAEELIFRLGMLGILRKHLKGETIMQKETWVVLFLNSGLFSLLHQNIFLSLFVLSLVYGYLFLNLGIVSSIVFHTLWNFYHSLEILVIVVVVIFSYESFIILRKRKRPFFRWYKRKFDAPED